MADPAAGIGLLAALASGAVSFLSPCVLPLVPGYLSAVTGVPPDRLDEAPLRGVLLPSLAFVATFSGIFVLLGLSATGIGASLRDHRAAFEKVAAVVIVALGLLFIASLFVTRLNREWHLGALVRRVGRGGPFLAGGAFAIAWTPCVGPTLGAILAAASLSASAGHGAVLLTAYSAGLGVPFLLTAVAFTRTTGAFAVVGRHHRAVMASGVRSSSSWTCSSGPVRSSNSTSRRSASWTVSASTP